MPESPASPAGPERPARASTTSVRAPVHGGTARVLLAPETFNFAEVTRAVEVARRMPAGVECVFAGFSPRNSEHVTAAGFEFHLLLPRLSDEEGELALAFDQGRTLRQPFTRRMLAERVASERALIRRLRPASCPGPRPGSAGSSARRRGCSTLWARACRCRAPSTRWPGPTGSACPTECSPA